MNRYQTILSLFLFQSLLALSPLYSQWADMYFPVNGSVKTLAVKDSLIFASAAEGRVLIAQSNSNQWLEPTSNLSGILVTTFLVHGDEIFAGTPSSGIFRSTDNGTSWNASGSNVKNVYSISFYDSTLYAATLGGVYSSIDNGLIWTRLNSIKSVKGVLLHEDRLFCASAEVGLYVSDDFGKIWSAAQNGIPSTTLSTIIKHENDLYIATYGSGVFRSSDDGANWVSVNTGLSNFDVLAFESINDVIFAGTYGGGVFASNTKGKVWVPVNTGATDFHVYGFAHDDTTMFMATGNSGVWRRPLTQFINLKSVSLASQANASASCFPNPFNSSTTINYTLDNSEEVLVEVYDILGRNVRTLVDGIIDAGEQVVTFNAAALPEGIYYTKLKTSSAQSQIKMILSK